jgi:hypothetical protein
MQAYAEERGADITKTVGSNSMGITRADYV